MRFSETSIPGVIVVEPDVHRDPRGFFRETYHAGKYAAARLPEMFVQDNHSLSARDTLSPCEEIGIATTIPRWPLCGPSGLRCCPRATGHPAPSVKW
jgi:hypothetical protein